MGWTAPATWVANAILTAAQLQAQLRDNLKRLRGPAQVLVYHNATQSVPNGALTAILLNSESYDRVDGAASTMHDVVTNNSRVTPNDPGIYLCVGHLPYAAQAVAAGTRAIYLRMNGTDYVSAEPPIVMTASFNTVIVPMTTSVVREFNGTTDYIEMVGLHTAGVALNALASASTTPCTLSVTRIG